MKLIVISDIHGSGYWLKKIEEIVEKEEIDKIIILGDLLYRSRQSEEYNPEAVIDILNKYKEKIECVRGNCDSDSDINLMKFKVEEYRIIEYNNKKILLTHGERYNIDNVPYLDFDIMMYGHIHQGFIKKINDILFLNPGSISCPKGLSKRSYIIIDNDLILLKDFEGNILQMYKERDKNE